MAAFWIETGCENGHVTPFPQTGLQRTLDASHGTRLLPFLSIAIALLSGLDLMLRGVLGGFERVFYQVLDAKPVFSRLLFPVVSCRVCCVCVCMAGSKGHRDCFPLKSETDDLLLGMVSAFGCN
jgi:hypothetical protein